MIRKPVGYLWNPELETKPEPQKDSGVRLSKKEKKFKKRVTELSLHDRPRFTTCRRCGMSGLVWIRMGSKWMMTVPGHGEIHICR